MKYARVAVNSPTPRIYSFALPAELPQGSGVWIPWGKDTVQGIILELMDSPKEEVWGDVFGPIKPVPLLLPYQIELALWLSSYYLTPIFKCLSLMFPPGWEQGLVSYLEATELVVDDKTAEEERLLKWLKKMGRVRVEKAEEKFGKRKLSKILPRLIKRGFIVQTRELEKPKIATRKERYVELNVPREEIPPHYQEKLRILHSAQPIPIRQLSESGLSSSTIYSLRRRGVLTIREQEVLPERRYFPSPPLPPLTKEQNFALEQIKGEIEAGTGKSFLLLGEDRKEIYLHLISYTLSLGKGVFCLSPSPSQRLIDYFCSHFPGRVAKFHHKLTLRGRYDSWLGIRYGVYDVVLGCRSALFAPLPKPGLIILDDEEDENFKEEEQPTYHSRDVSFKIAKLCGAVVLLGSETPDITTYHKAVEGEIILLKLPPRKAPEVEVVDLRQELKEGNRDFISRKLDQSLKETLKQGEKAILFLNRKGAYPLVRCSDCGFILLCRACDLPLNYHTMEGRLICHHCNYQTLLPPSCPRCGGKLSLFGLGIERLLSEASSFYPGEKILLYDKESVRRQAIEEFEKLSTGIALGTQIIARSDFPSASLVGIVLADANLNLPDFRAGERVFQLLWRVIGKAKKKVILQSYSPEHQVLKAVSKLDYQSFYQKEIEQRKRLGLPPFSFIARLVYKHPNADRCREEAEGLRERLVLERDRKGLSVRISGPSPAFLSRIKGRYRWQIILIGGKLTELLGSVDIPSGWEVDIDPQDFL